MSPIGGPFSNLQELSPTCKLASLHRGRCCIPYVHGDAVPLCRILETARRRRETLSAAGGRCGEDEGPGSPEEGHELDMEGDRGRCGWRAGDRCHGRDSQNGSAPANHRPAFGAQPHVPSRDHNQPHLADRRRPPAPAAAHGGQRRFCPRKGCLPLALFRGPLMHPRRVPGDGLAQVTLISHQTTNTRRPSLPETPLKGTDHPQPATPTPFPPLRLNSRYIPSRCLNSPPCRTPPVDRPRVPLCISITVCFGRAETMKLSLK